MPALLNQTLWWFSERSTVHGYAVGYAVEEAHRSTARARLEAAIDLLAVTRPRWLRRMRAYVTRIQVTRLIHSAGQWEKSSRQANLDEDYVCRASTSVAAIASTLVHEFTHARIDAAGVRYTRATRTRIERACVAQELAFLRSLPESPERQTLLEREQRKWDQAEELWGDEASERRWRHAVRTIGLPPWLIAGLLHVRRWRSRLRSVG